MIFSWPFPPRATLYIVISKLGSVRLSMSLSRSLVWLLPVTERPDGAIGCHLESASRWIVASYLILMISETGRISSYPNRILAYDHMFSGIYYHYVPETQVSWVTTNLKDRICFIHTFLSSWHTHRRTMDDAGVSRRYLVLFDHFGWVGFQVQWLELDPTPLSQVTTAFNFTLPFLIRSVRDSWVEHVTRDVTYANRFKIYFCISRSRFAHNIVQSGDNIHLTAASIFDHRVWKQR